MRTGKLWFLFLLIVLVVPRPASAGVSGTATVEYGTGEFAGYWCYTIDFTWDTPQSLSNLSNFVGLDGLACACDPGIFLFPDPAGTTTGVEDGVECTLQYQGEYLCTGNPSLPAEFSNMAALKWDPSPETCNAGTTGSGSITFCSLLAPGDNLYHTGVLVIKSATGSIIGDVTGPLPAADCTVDDHAHSMGTMKARFDR